MARYSKIDRRIWSDSGFRELSKPQPCGQALFWYLLTTPKLSALPGVIPTGEAELAEALEWSAEGLRKGFAELFRQGMAKADWKARLVWLPNAWKYNAPENPNVVKSWRIPWDELPECQLKLDIWQTLKELTERLGEGFAKAFAEGLPKPSLKGMANQEPEPEPEQKPKKDTAAKRPKSVETTVPDDFAISDRVRAWAAAKGHSRLPDRLEHFIGYVRAKGKRYADWDEAFMNAIRGDWAKLGSPPANGSGGPPKPAEPQKTFDQLLTEQGL